MSFRLKWNEMERNGEILLKTNLYKKKISPLRFATVEMTINYYKNVKKSS